MKQYISNEDWANLLGSCFHAVCNKYALSKLKDDDLILVTDCYDKYPHDVIITVIKNKKFYTVKRSSFEKYGKAYEKKCGNC